VVDRIRDTAGRPVAWTDNRRDRRQARDDRRVSLKLSVTDERGAAVSVDLTIVVHPKLALATKRLVSGRVGRSYRATIRTSGGVRPVTFTVLAGRLPTGMRLNTTTGVLSGKPRKAGIYESRSRRAIACVGQLDRRTSCR
jgi:Putative Ig domain